MPDGSTQPLQGKTDWAALEALTEEEITAAALSDPDNPPWIEEELARLPDLPNPKEIRQKLQMTQEQFAEQFQVPLGTLRDWEQGVSVPDSAARNYLRVIAKNPQAVLEALAG
ncbi:MAG: helix-turn-helix domain-containing protein [Caldilineaceae bacterium]|nr:helix-turn-helix domain-containing protein [Caldilineaceae bacterium]